MEVKIVNKSGNKLPEYAKPGDAGMDLRASLNNEWMKENGLDPMLFNYVVLEPGEWKVIPTDMYIQLPSGYEAQVRSRSGLAAKKGIFVMNSPGTVDEGYRGNIQIILFNGSKEQFVINEGDRIAQVVFNKYEKAIFKQVDELDDSERGEGGIGHTGVN